MTTNNPVNWAGRRFVNVDINTKWKDKDEIWDSLMEPFNNRDKPKMKAIYDFIVSHHEPGFNFQSEIKKISKNVDNRCPLPIQYIKQMYVLNNKEKLEYKIHRLDVYNAYVSYMKKNEKYTIPSSTNFYKILREHDIVNTKSNGKLPYTFVYDELLSMLKKFNFISEDELSIIEANDLDDKDIDTSNRDEIVFAIGKYKQRIAELEKMLSK